MSAASNDNEQASDLDEPMGSQSQVRSVQIVSSLSVCLPDFNNNNVDIILLFHAFRPRL